ncbi:MAG: DNA-binding domain-containing protein [Pseudomonadota bacterium]
MAPTLAAYQDAFARAVLAAAPAVERGDAAADAVARLAAQPGFAVYRNTVLRGCIDALQANFPAVARLVGDEWFRAAAAVFARASLPAHPTLLDYGAGFSDFLARFEPAAELPYLAEVARLDRLWTEAHVAADAPPLDPAELAALSVAELSRTALRVHPAARWFESDTLPVYTIWRRNRYDDAECGEIEWRGEGALLTRPHGEVLHGGLDAAGVAFVAACARGASIAVAVSHALARDPRVDLAALTHRLLQAGAFSGLHRIDHEEAQP